MVKKEEYTDEDLENHMKEIGEEIEEPLLSVWQQGERNYISVRELFGGEHPSITTYVNRWGRDKTKEKAIEYGIALSEEEKFELWADILKKKPGIHSVNDFRDILPKFHTHNSIKFIDYVNENVEGLNIRKNSPGGNRTRYYVKIDRRERFKEYKRQIPSEHDKWFDFGLNRGKSPLSIVAGITYLTGNGITQKEVAESLGVTPVTVRSIRDMLVKNGFPDDPPEL